MCPTLQLKVLRLSISTPFTTSILSLTVVELLLTYILPATRDMSNTVDEAEVVVHAGAGVNVAITVLEVADANVGHVTTA